MLQQEGPMGGRFRPARAGLALAIAGIVTGGTLYTVRAQDAPVVLPSTPAAPEVVIAPTPQAPDEKNGDRTKLRQELDSLLRQRAELDARIGALRGRLGERGRVFVWSGDNEPATTPEQRRKAEEAMRRAEEALKRAEDAMRDADRAVPRRRFRMFAVPPTPEAPMFVMPAIPPMPKMDLHFAPHAFEFDGRAWSDKDRAEWEKNRAQWEKDYGQRWREWADEYRKEWEKQRPEFEKMMREYHDRMKQWHQDFNNRMRERFKEQDEKSKENRDKEKGAPADSGAPKTSTNETGPEDTPPPANSEPI